jgi:hypothetical protein
MSTGVRDLLAQHVRSIVSHLVDEAPFCVISPSNVMT